LLHDRLRGAVRASAPGEVLADDLRAHVEAADAPGERAVCEVAAAQHVGRVRPSGGVELAVEAKRTQSRGDADLVHGIEDSTLGDPRELGGRTPGNYPKRNEN